MNTSNNLQTALSIVLTAINENATVKATAQKIKSSYCDQGYYMSDMGNDLAVVFSQCVNGLNDESASYCAKVMAKCFG